MSVSMSTRSRPSWIARQIWRGINYARRSKGWRKEKEKKDSMGHGGNSITNPGHRLGGPRLDPNVRILPPTAGGVLLIMDHDEDFAPVILRCFLHPHTHAPFHCTPHEPNWEHDRLVLTDTGSRTASEVVHDSMVLSQSRNLQNADHQPHES